MEKNAMNNQVIKAISIGLAAFIAATGPMEAQAAQSANTDVIRLHRAAQERASAVVAGNTDIEEELAAAKDTEQKLQQAFETVRLKRKQSHSMREHWRMRNMNSILHSPLWERRNGIMNVPCTHLKQHSRVISSIR